MNRNSLRLIAAAALALGTQLAHADSQTIQINATITAMCQLTSYPNMSITLDPTSTADGSGTTSIQYKCTQGTSGTFAVQGETDGSVARTLTGPGGATMAMTVDWTQPSGWTGNGLTGTANTVVLTGNVPNANYASQAAGTYTGDVSVSITP